MLIQATFNSSRRGTKRQGVALPMVLEDLEGRVLLSGAHHHGVAHHPAAVHHVASHHGRGSRALARMEQFSGTQSSSPVQTVNVQPTINIQPMINVQPTVNGGTASTQSSSNTAACSNPTTVTPPITVTPPVTITGSHTSGNTTATVHHQVVDQSCRHHGNERFLQRVPDQCDVDHDEYHLNSNAQRKHRRNIIDSDLLDLDALDQQ